MKCESCKEKAIVNITYGLYSQFKEGRPHYVVNLCKECAQMMWNEFDTLVNIGELHWVNKPI